MRKLIVSLSLALGMASTGCHNQTIHNITNGTINCADQQLMPLIDALMPSVLALLAGQTPNWKTDLDALVASAGTAAACAINNAVAQLQAQNQAADAGVPPADAGAVSAMPPSAASQAVNNGKQYILDHGWTFAQ